MKTVKNRFEQLIRARGISTSASHQIPITIDAFDKLADWAIDEGIYDRQMFFVRVSEWVNKYKLPRPSRRRANLKTDKSYKKVDDLVKEIRQNRLDKAQKVVMLKLNDDAYQAIIRWAVEQGAIDNDEMSLLFSDSILKAILPGQRQKTKENSQNKQGTDPGFINTRVTPCLEAVK